MANPVLDGTYTIGLPFGGNYITDTGAGRYLNLLGHDDLGKDADKIKVTYKSEQGAYSLQFVKSEKYLTWGSDALRMNIKLVTGDKPQYFKITPHEYENDKYTITPADDKTYHVSVALERIFPPWVALSNLPAEQAWAFNKA